MDMSAHDVSALFRPDLVIVLVHKESSMCHRALSRDSLIKLFYLMRWELELPQSFSRSSSDLPFNLFRSGSSMDELLFRYVITTLIVHEGSAITVLTEHQTVDHTSTKIASRPGVGIYMSSSTSATTSRSLVRGSPNAPQSSAAFRSQPLLNFMNTDSEGLHLAPKGDSLRCHSSQMARYIGFTITHRIGSEYWNSNSAGLSIGDASSIPVDMASWNARCKLYE